MAHPCLSLLRSRHADKHITVQSRSIQEDACALMTAQHLEYGDTTFAQVLEMMNENVKDVAMPSMLAGGTHHWYAAGTSEDPMGLLSVCSEDSARARRYSMYSLAGVQK